VLLVKATEPPVTASEAPLTSIVVPLDGSELAEGVLPNGDRIGAIPRSRSFPDTRVRNPLRRLQRRRGFYDPVHLESFLNILKEETFDYLEKKVADLKRAGLTKVSYVAKEGLSADEIIKFARETPANLVPCSSHGAFGNQALGCSAALPKRWCATPATRYWCCVPPADRPRALDGGYV